MIANNQTICSDSYESIYGIDQIGHASSPSSLSRVQGVGDKDQDQDAATAGIPWHSGVWTSKQSLCLNIYQSIDCDLRYKFRWNSSLDVVFDEEDVKLIIEQAKDREAPELTEDAPKMYLASDIALEYRYLPISLTLDSRYDADRRDLVLFHLPDDSTSTRPDTGHQRVHGDMQYHFIGSSHMRHWFDGFIVKTQGNDFRSYNLSGKHHDTSLYNMHYHSSLLVDDIVKSLEQLCEGIMRDPEARQTLLVQTGSWDLSLSSLRKLLHDPLVGPLLVDRLESVVNGSMACGSLRHIVWLTTVPYPLCYRQYGNKCDENKSFRSNAAIAAWNTFMIHALHRIIGKHSNNQRGNYG